VSSDDHTLLARMRGGEGSAFAALFSRYYDALCAFANGYTASRSEAEEVVEDVFMRLWELRQQLEVRESLKSYLYTATRNRSLNRLRDERAEARRLEEASAEVAAPGMGQPRPGLDEEIEAAEFARAVERAVEKLPPRTRQVFLLHRQHGLTYGEVAAALEISPKTVENQLGRALKHLRAHLARFLGE
jgi:RNA polymerase sigma-70 factor (ECF subfamily)